MANVPPSGQDVLTLLCRTGDSLLLSAASSAVETVTTLVKTYTRGQGFPATLPPDDLGAVNPLGILSPDDLT